MSKLLTAVAAIVSGLTFGWKRVIVVRDYIFRRYSTWIRGHREGQVDSAVDSHKPNVVYDILLRIAGKRKKRRDES